MTEQNNQYHRFNVKDWIMLLFKSIKSFFEASNKLKKEKKSKNNAFDNQKCKVTIDEENNIDGNSKKNPTIQEISDKKSNEIISIISEKIKKDNNEIEELRSDLKKNLIINEKTEIETKFDPLVDVDKSINEDENKDIENTKDVPCNNSKVGGSIESNIVEKDDDTNENHEDHDDSESISDIEKEINKFTIVDKGANKPEKFNNNRFGPYPNRASGTSESNYEFSNQNYQNNVLWNENVGHFDNINNQPTPSSSGHNFINNYVPIPNYELSQQNGRPENQVQPNVFEIIPPMPNGQTLPQQLSNNYGNPLFCQTNENISDQLELPLPSLEELLYLNPFSLDDSDFPIEFEFEDNFPMTQTVPDSSNLHNVSDTSIQEMSPTAANETSVNFNHQRNSLDVHTLQASLMMPEGHLTQPIDTDVNLGCNQRNCPSTQSSLPSPISPNSSITIVQEISPTPPRNTDVVLEYCKETSRQNQLIEANSSDVPKNNLYQIARSYCKRRLSPNFKHEQPSFQHLQNLSENPKENEETINLVLKRIKGLLEAKYLFWDEHLFEEKDKNNWNVLERILLENNNRNTYLLEFYVAFYALWRLGSAPRTRILNKCNGNITRFLESGNQVDHCEFIKTLLRTV